MELNKLRQKSKSDLEKILNKNKERLRVLNFDLAAKRVKNVKELRKIKKDIARILTVLRQTSESKLKH